MVRNTHERLGGSVLYFIELFAHYHHANLERSVAKGQYARQNLQTYKGKRCENIQRTEGTLQVQDGGLIESASGHSIGSNKGK